MKNILLVGGYPPPYGGITVHVQRLKQLLEDNGHKVIVLDLVGNTSEQSDHVIRVAGKNKLFTLVKSLIHVAYGKEEIVHFHTSAFGRFLYTAPFYLYFSRFKTKVITIHSGSFIDEVNRYGLLKRMLLRITITKFHKIVVVNDEQKKFLMKSFIESPDKIYVIPAFLPEKIDELQIRDEVKEKAEQIKKRNTKFILSSGFMQRYYGHHLVLQATEKIGQKLDTVICFYSSYDEAYRKELDDIRKGKENVHFFYDLSPNEFNYLMQHCDLYIRATDRDGDAVAIREALYLGKPVAASDCVVRPAEVTTFDRTNIKDMIDKIRVGLSKKSRAVGEDPGEKLKAVYGLLSREGSER
ncbi:glycosyltransferase family 4 protein [Gordoniibacillus kamchatkensis]|nr:glycosyltransferase family 4 protein [Paenibacillus sp. VKM B-2647]